MSIVIRIENVWKQYRLGVMGHGALYRDLQSWWARVRKKADPNSPIVSTAFNESNVVGDRIWALKDVSLEVKQGEVLGIIGRNGAGKSTLLKILSRVTAPTKGDIKIRGRVASLLEVGTGFHPELTGRENVFLNGAILGMTANEITKKLDDIIDFSGVEQYINTPVKRYSSGMYVRLAFAVAAHLEPEILLVDEVLAVGDHAFQRKCLGKLNETATGGRTVLFVSHNMGMIRQLCPTCVWLHDGKIRDYGPSDLVISRYLREDFITANNVESKFEEDPEKEAQMLWVRLRTQEDLPTQQFSCDEPVIIEFLYKVNLSVPGIYGWLEVSMSDGTVVLVSDSQDVDSNPLDNLAPGEYRVQIVIPARSLGPGSYRVRFDFASRMAKKVLVDRSSYVCAFTLDDFSTKRGNNRRGYFSTLLVWDVEQWSKG